ncbi:4-oxalocrotonate tautomerase [Ruminococcaceae bacterium OttesenSCG-928-L11]|nr:4-oxalocrotonate tautomerase [Ruminococcaceae bacterium OttesenSCG-928-L11]
MDDTRGITVKVPTELHGRARQEQESLALTMSSYITMILEEHFNTDRKGGNGMDKTRTLAFQVSNELFQRLKAHLARNPGMTQKSFVLGLIEQALQEAEGSISE